MKAEETLRQMFKQYPSLFLYREDCLDHLFLTIGNGYKWCKGQLVEADLPRRYVDDYDDSSVKCRKAVQDKDVLKRELDKHLEVIGLMLETLRSNLKVEKNEQTKSNILENIAKCKNIQANYKKTGKLFRGWYPYDGKFAIINQIPADIKSDWKKLALELLEYLNKDGITLQLSDRTKKRLGMD